MSTRTRKDWILWGALGCALVATAHAEYTLATAAHFNEYVALAVPGALDLYVIRALQQRRDVFVAVLVMVAANVTSHLITGGVLEVQWPVIAAVGAVAPLIVWRVYSLKYTRTRQELLWGTEAGPVSEPALEASAPPSEPECGCHDGQRCTDHCTCRECTGARLGYGSSALGGALDPQPLTAPVDIQWFDDVRSPDHVPADWMQTEYPETYPSAVHSNVVEFAKYSGAAVCVAHSVPECSECVLKYGSPYAPLSTIPALPPEYVSSGVTEPVLELKPSDYPYLAGVQEYTDIHADETTMRGLMRALSIGQDRATRLLAHAESEGWMK